MQDNTPPPPEILGRNQALEELGLPPKQFAVDWLEKHWEGHLKWDSSARKNRKGFPRDLIERLKSKNHPDVNTK